MVAKAKETTFHTHSSVSLPLFSPSSYAPVPTHYHLHCLLLYTIQTRSHHPQAQPQGRAATHKHNHKEMPSSSQLLFLLFASLLSTSFSSGTQIILVNNCNESVWPGILGGAGQPSPADGGLHLTSGEEKVINIPDKWSGRIWGRQGCCFDANGKGSCDTGDCAGLLHCRGMGGSPPATVVEMTFGTSKSALHYYDVSLVDGFNLPVSMVPVGGGVGCGVAACEANLNVCCPSMFEVKRGGRVVGCKSACMALKTAKYCCTGDYASPKSCKPTLFSHLFKAICPLAYSFAYDDSTSLRTCRASRYVITFCPPPR